MPPKVITSTSKPAAVFTRTSGAATLKKRIDSLKSKAVYVGIPAGSAREREQTLMKMAGKKTGKKGGMSLHQLTQAARLQRKAGQAVTNAELLFVFSKGSPRRNQPPRPVLEPAIEADGNRQAIAAELAEATRATLKGESGTATRRLQRAGVAGANAARSWFTDSRNGWAQNAPATIRRKLSKLTGKRRREAMDTLNAATGFSAMPLVGQNAALDSINTPGVDIGAMRQAITWVLQND